MDVLKFNLKGKTAFFKKPEVNSFFYFTYGNIHKVALMGLLGAICGYGGYNKQQNNEFKITGHNKVYPEFYSKLQNIKVGIAPKGEGGYFYKKIQNFNNSVGYASKENGGNLIIKEQWLENVEWDIYILLKDQVSYELAERLLNFNFTYVPYLGKNDHFANISNVEIIKDSLCEDNPDKIHSLYYKECFNLSETLDFEFEDSYEIIWKYEEMLPVSLEEKTNKYELKSFVYTNSFVYKNDENISVYNCKGKNIFFF